MTSSALRVCLLLTAVLAVSLWVLHAVLAITFPFQLEYGEGAVLGFSRILREGKPLYVDLNLPPYLVCIYAPLHLWLAGSQLWQGRLLVALSTVVTMATLAWIAGRQAGRVAAVAAVAFFVAHPLVLNWTVLNRIDMLPLACVTLALGLATREGSGWKDEVAIALLSAAALLAKQSYLAGPAAIVGGLVLQEPRRGLRLALWMSLCVGLSYGWLNWVTHGWAWHQLFGYNKAIAQGFLPNQLLMYWRYYGLSVLPLAVLAVYQLSRQPNLTWILYLLAGVAMGIGSGRPAAYYNYFLELHMGLCAVAAPAVGAWRGALLTALQLACGAFCSLPPTLFSPLDYLIYEARTVAQGRYPTYLARSWDEAGLEPWLTRYPGPVLAENMANVLAQGVDPWFLDPVTYRVMAEAGIWDQGEMLSMIEQGRFSLIVLQATEGNLRFTPDAIRAVLAHYHKVAQAGVDSVYRPNEEGPAVRQGP